MDVLPENPDFAILTIIDAELEAVKKVFSLQGPIEKDGRLYYHGTVVGPDGTKYYIICTQSLSIGNNAASIAATDVINQFNPKYFFLVGIAGGIMNKKDLKLGDVVASTEIKYYELEKQTNGERKDRSGVLHNPALSILNVYGKVKSEDWWKGIDEERPSDKDNNPKAIAGQILSGDKLLGDPKSELLNRVLNQHDKALAVEMESGGFARALYEKSATSTTQFMVIRGISDFCNASENQKTRDDWRKYAANSSAVFAKKIIENTEIDTKRKTPHEVYLDDFDSSIPSKPKIEFSLKIQTPEGEISADSLHEYLKQNRKVLLNGPAGGGKSVIVTKLSRYMIQENIVPIFIELKKRNSKYSRKLREVDGSTVQDKMNVILNACSVPIDIEKIESFNKKRCIIVDGLNEISAGEYGQETPRMIIDAVYEYVKKTYPDTYCLVTDRLLPRNFFEGWKITKVQPIDPDEVKLVIDDKFDAGTYETLSEPNKEILSAPYFLDYSLERDSPVFASESAALEGFFQKHLELNESEIDVLATSVFQAKTKNHDLAFSLEDIKDFGDENIKNLQESGILKSVSEEKFVFDHQLKHEYLFSRFLAKNQAEWNSTSFDIATLESNSPESIYLTLQQIPDKDLADKFLLKVYDWNWNAAITSIIKNSKLEIKNYSEEIEIAMLALVAQKQFDSSHGTSSSAKEKLVSFESSIAKQFADAKDLKELFKIIGDVEPKSEWFKQWKALFTIDRKSEISEDTIKLIQSPNSLLGWTASNVLRECNLSESNQLKLRTILESSDADDPTQNTRRWRVIHTLGRFPSRENAKLLFNVLESDSYHWARYGGARALVEMVAATSDKELRGYILETLYDMLGNLKQNVLEEIGKTVFYKDAYGSWDEDAILLLEKIKGLQKHDQYTEKWNNTINEYKEKKWKNNP